MPSWIGLNSTPAPCSPPLQAEETNGSEMAPAIAILYGIGVMFVGGLSMVISLLFSLPVCLWGVGPRPPALVGVDWVGRSTLFGPSCSCV